MKLQTNHLNFNVQKNAGNVSGNSTSFKGVYTPRTYTQARKLADAIYENTSGPGKVLMWLKKHDGENLNNTVTAVGTTGVAPIFIAFNPFSHEDTKSKYYTALRQPVSAVVALATQLFVMINYNNWIDKHAAYLGVDEMDLQAKPPATVLKSRANGDYAHYYSECLKTGVEPEGKSKWVANRIRQIQDESFYNTLEKLRANADNLNIKIEDTVKLDLLKEKRDECFKDVLKKKYSFSDVEADNFKDFNEFISKKGKKICKTRSLDFDLVRDAIDSVAMKKAVEVAENAIDAEAKVKLQTSLYKSKMQQMFASELLNLKKDSVMVKADPTKNKKTSAEKLEAELARIKHKIYQRILGELKPEYDEISKISANKLAKDEEKVIKKQVYEKLLSHADDPIDGLKNHGTDFEKVKKSIMIKKYLINRINRSEAKLEGWKKRSGLIVGLMILPLTCGLLNWAYPKFMKKYFPKLSEAKAASKAKSYGLNVDNNKKDIKEAK